LGIDSIYLKKPIYTSNRIFGPCLIGIFKPGKIEDTAASQMFNAVRPLFQKTSGDILISIPELCGAFNAYGQVVEFIKLIHDEFIRPKPDEAALRQLLVEFPGNYAPRLVPTRCNDGDENNVMLVERADVYPGTFCSRCVQQIVKIDHENIHVVVAQGNSEVQDPWGFIQTAGSLKASNIPFLSTYSSWVRNDLLNVMPDEAVQLDERQCAKIQARSDRIESTETLESYGLSSRLSPGVQLTKPWHIVGNTLFFPFLAASIACNQNCFSNDFAFSLKKANGGEHSKTHAQSPVRCYLGDWKAVEVYRSLTEGLRVIEDPIGSQIVPKIAQNFGDAIRQLCRDNPGDGYLNVVVPAAATFEQTQRFLTYMFHRCPETVINEQNFPGNASRIRMIVTGGFEREDRVEEIEIEMNDKEKLKALFCSATRFGDSINCVVLGNGGP
jgi:hypothetical protein